MPEPIDFSKLDPSKLDEYANNDPVWRAVNDHLKTLPTVTEWVFLGRTTDCFLFVGDLLDVLKVAGSQIVRRKMRGIPQLVQRYMRSDLSNEAMSFFSTAMEAEFQKKVGQYEPFLLNQGLVMLCTILDVFWEHVVDVIYVKHVSKLCASDDSRMLALNDLIVLGSVDVVVRNFREKEVRRFGFLDTDKRLKYMERRLGLRRSKIFDWSHYTEEVQRQLRGWDAATLKQIFNDRHAIVHGDKLPITSLERLSNIKDFFDKLILNTALEARDTNQVMLESHRLVLLPQLYAEFKATQTNT